MSKAPGAWLGWLVTTGLITAAACSESGSDSPGVGAGGSASSGGTTGESGGTAGNGGSAGSGGGTGARGGTTGDGGSAGSGGTGVSGGTGCGAAGAGGAAGDTAVDTGASCGPALNCVELADGALVDPSCSSLETPPDLFSCGVPTSCRPICTHNFQGSCGALDAVDCAAEHVESGEPGVLTFEYRPGPGQWQSDALVFLLGDGRALRQQRYRQCPYAELIKCNWDEIPWTIEHQELCYAFADDYVEAVGCVPVKTEATCADVENIQTSDWLASYDVPDTCASANPYCSCHDEFEVRLLGGTWPEGPYQLRVSTEDIETLCDFELFHLGPSDQAPGAGGEAAVLGQDQIAYPVLGSCTREGDADAPGAYVSLRYEQGLVLEFEQVPVGATITVSQDGEPIVNETLDVSAACGDTAIEFELE